jgi:hypothetical protein
MRGDGGDNRSTDASAPISFISPYPHIPFSIPFLVSISWLRLCRAVALVRSHALLDRRHGEAYLH